MITTVSLANICHHSRYKFLFSLVIRSLRSIQQLSNIQYSDFSGGLVVKTLHFQTWGLGSIPSRGAEIPHAMPLGQKWGRKYPNTQYSIIN